jgi:hypothetical protein
MMNDKQLPTDVLAAMGFCVETIDPSPEKRADLLVRDGKSTYLIEVKHKFDNGEWFRDCAERLDRGEEVYREEPLAYNKAISKKLAYACTQLKSTPAPSDAYRLIWFHAAGVDHDLHWKRAFATFYGSVHLWPKDPPGDIITCLYFDYNAAWSMRDVEAMVLTDGSAIQLCLNEFSGQLEAFRTTRLYQKFATRGGVFDPIQLARDGAILVCRSDVSRRQDDVILRALLEQTGTLYDVIRPKQCSASVKVDPNLT